MPCNHREETARQIVEAERRHRAAGHKAESFRRCPEAMCFTARMVVPELPEPDFVFTSYDSVILAELGINLEVA